MSDIISQIKGHHRERCFMMETRKRNDLALGAFLRVGLGWSKNLPDSERKEIESAARSLDETDPRFGHIISGARQACKPFEAGEKQALKAMTKLAEQLPAWKSFGEEVRGFGAGSLAVIVGEAGDLSNYSTISKLWKRMGLAVFDGVRQGGLGKGAGADAWIEHGYSPVRRSRMWNIGEAIIKSNRDGYYRKVYVERKAFELARDPDIQPIKAHRRAQRYMEKRLLKHLWQAWRRAEYGMVARPTGRMPDASNSVAA